MFCRISRFDLLITVNAWSKRDEHLLITVNLCRWWAQGFYWLQWTLVVEKERSSRFTDYSEHPNSVNFVVARWPAPFVHLPLLITVNLSPLFADYSEPFTDCSEHHVSTACWLQWTFQQFQPQPPLSFLYLKASQGRTAADYSESLR